MRIALIAMCSLISLSGCGMVSSDPMPSTATAAEALSIAQIKKILLQQITKDYPQSSKNFRFVPGSLQVWQNKDKRSYDLSFNYMGIEGTHLCKRTGIYYPHNDELILRFWEYYCVPYSQPSPSK